MTPKQITAQYKNAAQLRQMAAKLTREADDAQTAVNRMRAVFVIADLGHVTAREIIEKAPYADISDAAKQDLETLGVKRLGNFLAGQRPAAAGFVVTAVAREHNALVFQIRPAISA